MKIDDDLYFSRQCKWIRLNLDKTFFIILLLRKMRLINTIKLIANSQERWLFSSKSFYSLLGQAVSYTKFLIPRVKSFEQTW